MKGVEYIWAPRYGVPRIDHPIGGKLNDIVILNDKQYRHGPKKGKGFVYNGAYAGAIPFGKFCDHEVAYAEEDPTLSGNPSVHVRVKEYIAILTPAQAVSFFFLQMYVWSALWSWQALSLRRTESRVTYLHGGPELEIRALLPDEIRQEAAKIRSKRGWIFGGSTVQLRVKNCTVGIDAAAMELMIAKYWRIPYKNMKARELLCQRVRPFTSYKKFLFPDY